MNDLIKALVAGAVSLLMAHAPAPVGPSPLVTHQAAAAAASPSPIATGPAQPCQVIGPVEDHPVTVLDPRVRALYFENLQDENAYLTIDSPPMPWQTIRIAPLGKATVTDWGESTVRLTGYRVMFYVCF